MLESDFRVIALLLFATTAELVIADLSCVPVTELLLLLLRAAVGLTIGFGLFSIRVKLMTFLLSLDGVIALMLTFMFCSACRGEVRRVEILLFICIGVVLFVVEMDE